MSSGEGGVARRGLLFFIAVGLTIGAFIGGTVVLTATTPPFTTIGLWPESVVLAIGLCPATVMYGGVDGTASVPMHVAVAGIMIVSNALLYGVVASGIWVGMRRTRAVLYAVCVAIAAWIYLLVRIATA